MHSHQGFPWEARQEKARSLRWGDRGFLAALPGGLVSKCRPLCPLSLSCCHDGAGEGWEEKQGITGEAPEGEKPTLLSWAPETLESDPSGCSGELVVHPTPVGQHDRLGSGLGSFPAPGCWFPPPALPFSTLRPAAAHPPGESVFQALKTKLPGG